VFVFVCLLLQLFLPLLFRCSQAEQQLSALKDLEEDSYYDNGGSSSAISTVSAGGLSRRNNNRNIMNKQETGKVFSDLEKIGVKPGSGVQKAVSFLDSWALFTGR
jgi:hypothetical protein